jgi:dTDP-4-amino-4,6-dideoxygalactose transaminase
VVLRPRYLPSFLSSARLPVQMISISNLVSRPSAEDLSMMPIAFASGARFSAGAGSLPVTERLMDRVISLPMHSDLNGATQDHIIAAVASYKA